MLFSYTMRSRLCSRISTAWTRESPSFMKRVLVALDMSDNSAFVLARAVELATALGAKVRLLTVAQLRQSCLRRRQADLREPVRGSPWCGGGDARARAQCSASVARRSARRARRRLRGSSVPRTLLRGGLRRHRSSPPTGALARALGTTAARIVNNIDRPLIVVRPLPSAVGSSTEESGTGICAGAILRRDHERLEKVYDDFLDAYRCGEWERVRKQWDVFEPALRTHMDTEEQDVFPELRMINHDEADALIANHAELRRLLETLAIGIELHAVPIADAQELIACLRAHSAREERLLYPWMDRAIRSEQASPPEACRLTRGAGGRAAAHWCFMRGPGIAFAPRRSSMPTSPPLSLAALPFLLVAVSCHGSPSHVPRDETRHGASPFLRAQMRDHDAHGAALRDAVARADLIAARREAHALREVGVDGIALAEGGEALEALHLAAARLEGAIDLVEASRALADVARSCGDCHARLGGPRPIVARCQERRPASSHA